MTRDWTAIAVLVLAACGTTVQQPAVSPLAQSSLAAPPPPPEAIATSSFAVPPNPGLWEALPPMSVPRIGFTATLMSDGRVLIAGGRTQRFADSMDGTPISIVEIFDPTSRTFSRAPSLGTARDGHTATLLLSGRVLVAGGDPLGTAEIYDPISNTWTLTAHMKYRQFDHAPALIAARQVLVTRPAA